MTARIGDARPRPPVLVVASRPGQLGNMLLLSAHFIAAARRHGVSVANPALGDYSDWFEGSCGRGIAVYPARGRASWAWRCHRGAGYFLAYGLARLCVRLAAPPGVGVIALDWGQTYALDDPRNLDWLRSRRLVLCQGWQFRVSGGLLPDREALRDYFRPIAVHGRAVAAFLESAHAGATVLVGVHVRRGDYRRFMGGRFLHSLSDYAGLMGHVAGELRGRAVRFVVCSDEALDLSVFRPLEVVPGPGSPLRDLYALAGCDLLVAPPSTFSMWASFYGGVPLYQVADPSIRPSLGDFRPYLG